jgi:hypothetical protein
MDPSRKISTEYDFSTSPNSGTRRILYRLFFVVFIVRKREERTPFVAAGVHCRSVMRE